MRCQWVVLVVLRKSWFCGRAGGGSFSCCCVHRRAPGQSMVVMALPKAVFGKRWARLFRGDTVGERCCDGPGGGGSPGCYLLTELPDEVLVELEVRPALPSHPAAS